MKKSASTTPSASSRLVDVGFEVGLIGHDDSLIDGVGKQSIREASTSVFSDVAVHNNVDDIFFPTHIARIAMYEDAFGGGKEDDGAELPVPLK